MATYVNDLRLTELATGEGSGTWGTTTNTNLELIGEALGYGTQDCFASDADATTTVADGVSDPARAMYFKVTSSATLTATRTLTIAPNTVSRVMLIENATTGSQSIAISQGSGGNVTIASGQTKMVYLDGAGATGAVVDALADLELGTITVANLTATTADINGGSVDGVTLGTNSAVTEAQIDNININGNTISSTDTNGNVTITPDGTGSVAITKIDVAGGEIDGTAIGANSASTGAFTTLNATGGGALTGTWTDLGSVTTVDINGGTIDGVTIGGSSAGAITGTTGQFNTSLNVDGTVTADGLTVNTISVAVSQEGSVLLGANAQYGMQLKQYTTDGGTPHASVVAPDDTNGWLSIEVGGDQNEAARFAANGDISFYEDTGTTPKFFWDASAEALGIGTSSPTDKLNISSASNQIGLDTGDQTTYGTLDVGHFTNGAFIGTQAGSNAASDVLRFGTSGTERMRLDSAGNLGLGVTPSAWGLLGGLQVNVAALTEFGNNGYLSTNAYYNGSNWVYINSDNAHLYTQENGTHTWQTAASGTAGNTISFTQAMTLDASGNLGIGITSPADNLHLNGAANDSTGLTIGNNNSTRLRLYHDDAAGTSYLTTDGMQTEQSLRVGSGTFLAFDINGSEAARIDSSGNVGVGVTPSAWGSPFSSVMQFTKGAIAGQSNSILLLNNSYFDGTNYKYISTAGAGIYEQTNGIHLWQTAASGTAGTNISFSEAMRIDSSGNLLVGKTSAVGKVDIESSKTTQLYINGLTGVTNFALFHFNGGAVGSISTNGVTTAYNTSSDARLKENIANAEDAGAKVDAIQVRQFDWKADGSHQDYGMIAQELMTVAPEAVSGDPESDDMMGVDYSKLVPMLVKEIQSLRARVHALEGK